MDLSYTEISIIDLLGLIQGLILGGILIYLGHKQQRASLFLGLFVIAYALDLLPSIIEELEITSRYAQLSLLPFEFFWFLFPLFYIYVRQTSIIAPKKKALFLLIPGGIVFLLNLVVFFQSNEVKQEFTDSIWYSLIDIVGLAFSLAIGIKTYFFINKHSQALRNQYSETQKKELRWAKQFLLMGIAFTLVSQFHFFENNYYARLFTSIINVALLYWVSVHGILQKNIESLLPDIYEPDQAKPDILNFKSDDKSKALFEKVEQSIIDNKTYIRQSITIMDVSSDINEHPKRVSQVINQETGKNFKAYINSFRITDAKAMLNDQNASNLSIEGIGLEVGFKSKSSFYEAFKKETGLTPSGYKKAS